MRNNKPIAIVGAGIAGCTTARLLAKCGREVVVFERSKEIATGGSGNPAAMLYPRLSGNNVASQFALQAFEFSLAFYQSLDLPKSAFQQVGLLQLGFNGQTRKRIQKVASAFPKLTQLFDSTKASEVAGVVCENPALFIEEAAWIKPQLVCQQLLDHDNITLKNGSEILSLSEMLAFDHVILCNAHQAGMFEQTSHLTLNPVRGQVSLLAPNSDSSPLNTILCSDGYINPVIEGEHSLGATFETDIDDLSISSAAHQQNLSKLVDLSPSLEKLKESSWQGRVGLRCVTQDRLPMVGGVLDTRHLGNPLPRAGLKENTLPWHARLWVNIAHGSHGFINAPYSAHLLTRLITQAPNQNELDHLALLNPNRFYLRQQGLKQLARTVASPDMSQLHFAPTRDLS